MSGAAAHKMPSTDGPALLDRELEDLPPDMRWREWMNRIEAVIFASSTVVDRSALQSIVGQGANIDLLIADIQVELKPRPYELVAVAGGWMHRTRPHYADAIHAAADLGEQSLNLNETEMAVLCAIAFNQPASRADLADIFGKQPSPDVLNRLRHKDLIANGPRAPRLGAPQTFVTTKHFLATFDLQDLRDLHDRHEEHEVEFAEEMKPVTIRV
ncbi:SMC-Scp complex subunit ScpB [Hoeflea sp.]|uniref:SMC-Scp complex subunit ScpB n=1 Tax=Hoeflea sp. TaxID=1940281 RepID=UPI003B01A516